MPADVPQPAPVPGYRAEQVQMEVVGPPPAANPIQAPGPAFGQLSLQQFLQSPQEGGSGPFYHLAVPCQISRWGNNSQNRRSGK